MSSSSRFECRSCAAPLTETFADLGLSPPANSFVTPEDAERPETFYPLHVRVCSQCYFVQLPEVLAPQQIFQDYAYFSSYSSSWLEHAARYATEMVSRWGLGPESQVIEVASNDGYLLRHFRERGIPVLGIEPAANVARVAQDAGIETLVRFFGRELARELATSGRRADLLLGNNVLAHVPDINDFVGGMTEVLAPAGVLTFEFPHLLRLMLENQFDTIYHEHYSYLSLLALEPLFERHRLEVFDVDELPTHGGSLRLYLRHRGAAVGDEAGPGRVASVLRAEREYGLDGVEAYRRFHQRVAATKRQLLEFLIRLKGEGCTIVGYGAPAKGNTLLNYCGIGPDFLDYTVDRSPHKQGRLLPGTRIPIRGPEAILETRPDYVLILPWNLQDEIRQDMAGIAEWGGRFVVAIPEVRVLS